MVNKISHSPIGPSSFARIVQCPGSVKLTRDIKRKEHPSAKEGTAAHWALELILNGGVPGSKMIAPNGVAITDEMIDAVTVCVDYVNSITHNAMDVETRIEIKCVHDQCFGTVDIILLADNIVHIIDFKYGYRPVYAFENWQLMLYALGFAHTDQVFGPWYGDIHLHIVQPRVHHVTDIWKTHTATLIAEYLPIAQRAAMEAFSDNPTANTGPQCHYCDAMHDCDAFTAAAGGAMEMSGRTNPVELTPNAIGVELTLLERALEILQQRKDALLIQGLEIAKTQQITNYHVGNTQSRLYWKDNFKELDAAVDVDLYNDPKPITPTQAIKKGVDEAVIMLYAKRSNSSLKLIPNKDKFKRIFTKV